MIKTGILGADSAEGGELLRILVNHPEVDLAAAYAPALKGRPVSSLHYGLVGETDLCFTDSCDPAELDMIFVCRESPQWTTLFARLPELENLRVVTLFGECSPEMEDAGMVFGLSEIFRKPLVRGARLAAAPQSAASLALIALYPLAAHLLLTDPIQISIEGNPAATATEALKKAERQCAKVLSDVQQSFGGQISFHKEDGEAPDSQRGIMMKMSLPLNMPIEEILPLYEGIYDDHNFTFLTDKELSMEEVTGTQKCLLRLRKADSHTLQIEAVADAVMRGGAGEAVHLMNLLFALQEKIGLTFKAY